MALFKHTVDTPEAVDVMFSPSSSIPASNVQEAIQYVWDNVNGGVGGTYAPVDSQYIVSTADGTLTNERVLTDTATITWDDATLGQMKANWQHLGLESLSDPGADRLYVWDDSAGASAFFSLGDGLTFSASQLTINSANLTDLRDITFTTGDLLYYDGANLNRLAIGSNYQFLRVNGSGQLDWLTFPTGSGAGDMISANNLSDVASVSGARASLSVYSIAETDAAIAAAVTAEDLDFAGDSGTGAVDLDSQSLTITTSNDSLVTTALNQTLTISLADVLEDLDTLGPNSADGEFLVGTGAGALAWESGNTARTSLGLGTGDSPQFTSVKVDDFTLTNGGVIAFRNAGDTLDDVTITHSTNNLAFAGVSGAGVYSFDHNVDITGNIVVSGTVDGRDIATDGSTLDTLNANALLDSDIGSVVQAWDAQLDSLSSASADGVSLVTAANYAAMRTLLDLEAGTDFYSISAADAQFAAIGGAFHDGFSDFVADEHVAHSGVTLTAGAGLTGGGTIAASRSFAVGAGTGITVNADDVATSASQTHVTALGTITTGTWSATDVGLAHGGTGASLTDPNDDRMMFWDDSAGSTAWLDPTNGIEISDTSVQMTANQRTGCITYVIDGGGSAITTGIKGDFSVPAGCTITSVTALADQTGSIVIDIWKDTYANFPPTDADSITSAAPVTISAATKATDSTLTGWTTAISAGDILRFNVDSVSTVTRVTLEIRVTKT